MHTSAASIAQSSIPGFRLFIRDRSRSSTASKAKETPTIAVTETTFVLFRSGILQISPVILLVATDIRDRATMCYT